jgi:hypothetical protein
MLLKSFSMNGHVSRFHTIKAVVRDSSERRLVAVYSNPCQEIQMISPPVLMKLLLHGDQSFY